MLADGCVAPHGADCCDVCLAYYMPAALCCTDLGCAVHTVLRYAAWHHAAGHQVAAVIGLTNVGAAVQVRRHAKVL